MAFTYKAIASTTVGSGGASSITFSSIPQTYTDLVILTSLRQDTADQVAKITFNGSSSGYSDRFVWGTGSSALSNSDSSQSVLWFYAGSAQSGQTANTFGNAAVYIPNYAGSNNKLVSYDSVNENNATDAQMFLTAGLWANSAAITSITISPNSSKFVQYSTATLYGISNS